jgi:flagellar protein FliO/FliZ
MQIIQVGKKYLVIAVCKDTIVTLTEVSEEDIKIPEYGNGKDVFSKILEKVKSNKVDINKDKEQDAEKVEEDE